MELKEIIKHLPAKCLLTAFFVLLTLVMLDAKSLAQDAKRLSFSNGKRQVKISGITKMGNRNSYVIKLRKGQICVVDIEWQGRDIGDEGQGLSGYSMVFPNGKTIEDPQDNYLLADVSGDYKIVVSPKTKKTNYRYRIVLIQN